MVDKRNSVRKNRRIQLRYGIDDPIRVGFTYDVSTSGFFIQSSLVVKPGTLLDIELKLPNASQIRLKGRVQWAKKVPPNLLSLVKKGGMGIRIIKFSSGETAYGDFCAALYNA
jgi:hypothetical protein